MPATTLNSVLPSLRLSLARQTEERFTDGELLEQFITEQDSQAFETLLRQHAPMVLGVCRRILRNESDAEDAFQATFLVLIRKAASIVPRKMVGNWLYGVAYFTATKARAMSTKRAIKERTVALREEACRQEKMDELHAILDQELHTLPDIYRSAIVLCDLEGKSIKQAAEQLSCPTGTLGARLTRGRSILAQRITRRTGLPASGMLAACLSNTAEAVPPTLIHTTAHALKQSAFSCKVMTLTNTVMQGMLLAKLKLAVIPIAALMLSVATLMAGSSMLTTPVMFPIAWQDSGESKLPQPASPKPVKAAHFVWSVAFTPDGRSMVISEGNNLVRLWEVKTQLPGKAFEGAQNIIRSVAVSPDSKLVAGGGDEGIVFVWDVATQKLLHRHDHKEGGIHTVTFSPDGQLLASSHRNSDKQSSVHLHQSISGKYLYSFYSNEGTIPYGTGISLAFKPDGKELALVQQGHFTGIKIIECSDSKLKSTSKRLMYESPLVPQSVAWSLDGMYLATGGTAPAMPNPNNSRLFGMPVGHVKLWDARTGKLIETLFDNSDGDVKALAFSKTANHLYVATTTKMGEPFQTKDGLVGLLGGSYQCWDISLGKKLWEAQGKGGITFNIALSPDGKKLAIANSAGGWLINDTASGKQLRQFAETSETPPVDKK
ncbi:MAG: sigma-70 family RNA polymerase sigma factor [Gemmatales bacterium]